MPLYKSGNGQRIGPSWLEVLVVVLLVAMLGVLIFAVFVDTPGGGRLGSAANAASERSISVDGEGRATTLSDRANFVASVEASAATVAAARAIVDRQSNAVVAALTTIGSRPDVQIETSRYSVEPQYNAPADRARTPPVVVGYRAVHDLAVEVRGAEQVANVGALIAAATSAGANRVSALQYSISADNPARRQARERAVQNAAQRAQQLAQAGNVRLGPLRSVSEQAFPLYARSFAAAAAPAFDESAGGEPAPVQQPQQQEIEHRVSVVYGIA